MGSHALKRIRTKTNGDLQMAINYTNGRRNNKFADDELEQEKEEEPASPATRLFHTKALNCYIIAMLGSAVEIGVDAVKKGIASTLLNHPRFSSVLVVDEAKGVRKWIRTKVNLEDHVFSPKTDPNIESPDEFVENYTSSLSTKPMDMTKPLWELHILNIKTSESEAVAILKLHHSIGDGMSIISLVLACSRKVSDPEALPTIPTSTKKITTTTTSPKTGYLRHVCFSIWFWFMMLFNTVVDGMWFLASVLFFKDTDTPMKGPHGVEHSPKRIVHRTVNFDDVKLVKNALNMTINDVIMGIVQAGFSRYLNRRYASKNGSGGCKNNNLPKNILLRGTIVFNNRSSPGIKALSDMMEKKSKAPWGNKIGYVLTQIPIGLLDDPLDYLRQSKIIIDRKKHSLESKFTFAAASLAQYLFGTKVGAFLTNRVLSHTTVLISNVGGPQEEITLFGHKLVYVAPTICGLPHGVTIHFQSYHKKMTISMAVDTKTIPDPYQLCDDLEESLKMFKDACS